MTNESQSFSSGLVIEKDVVLAPYTSWQVGGPAELFCLPTDLDQVKDAYRYAKENDLSVSILGSGTNALISDQGISGLTICAKKLKASEGKESDGRFEVIAESGVLKTELLKIFIKRKLPPAEFLAGVPGDVGGGVVMNAGVGEQIKPREFVEITDWIEVLSLNEESFLEIIKYERDELRWSYRHCHGWEPGFIYRAQISWEDVPDPEVVKRVREANQKRLKKQPLDMPSCGSVFVNPEGHKSGQLIDQCGLRGFSIGDAQVSEKHANFIVNTGNATATDIDKVIRHVQAEVKKQKAIELRTEVVYLGAW